MHIFYQNVNRARTKLTEIYLNVLNNEYDLICLTETNLNASIHNGELFDERYNVFRRDRQDSCSRKEQGGGVLIAVNKHINVVRQTHWESDLEDVWLSIIPSKDGVSIINVCVCYLPPDLSNSVLSDFYSHCNGIILNANSNTEFILIGDFNTHKITWNQSQNVNAFQPSNAGDYKAQLLSDTINVCNLLQFNNVANYNSRYLDLVISSLKTIVVKEEEPICRFEGHHPALSITLLLKSLNNDRPIKQKSKERLNYSKCNYELVKGEISSSAWTQILSSSGIDECIEIFYNVLYEIIKKNTPTFGHKSKKDYPIWYSNGLIRCIVEKNKYHKRFKKYGNPRDYDSFSMLRSRCRILMRESHKTYLLSVEDSLKTNPRCFWRYINSKKGRVTVPQTMSFGKETTSDSQGICELFSKFFGSVFEHPSVNHLNPTININDCDLLSGLHIDEIQILNKIKHLDRNKGAGPDEIPPSFIITCASELSYPLWILFNKSLNAGTFPSRWKIAHIIPIYKSGDKSICDNYRPISILSTFSKLFESIIYDSIYAHVKNKLSDSQHGFIKNRSTLSNLLEYKNYICESFATGGQVDAVYTDFSKAFDKVNHALLIDKIGSYGVHGNLLRWVCSYLSNRSQLVAIKGYISSPVKIVSGIPQGSHLGPLLFIIFINDLVSYLKCPTLLYADDLKIFLSVSDIDSCLKIQRDLDTLASWCNSNGMALNTNKCSCISFTKKRQRTTYNYSINGILLERKSIVKDLGVVFDEQLSFRSHYEQIINKGNQLLGFIVRSTKNFKKPQSLITLFCSVVRPILEYACPIWSPHYKIYTNNIERVQKRCLKILLYRCNIGRRVLNYEERLHRFHLSSLDNRRKRYDLICLHKLIHSKMDSTGLLSMINFNTRYKSRTPNIFSLQVYRNNTSYYNPIVRMCRFCNEVSSKHNDIDIFDPSLTHLKRSLQNAL